MASRETTTIGVFVIAYLSPGRRRKSPESVVVSIGQKTAAGKSRKTPRENLVGVAGLQLTDDLGHPIRAMGGGQRAYALEPTVEIATFLSQEHDPQHRALMNLTLRLEKTAGFTDP
jgi:hypothetical protein